MYDYDSHVLIRDATFPDNIATVDVRPGFSAIAVSCAVCPAPCVLLRISPLFATPLSRGHLNTACQGKTFIVDGIKGSLICKVEYDDAVVAGAKFNAAGVPPCRSAAFTLHRVAAVRVY